MAIRITEDGTVIYENEPDINRELFPNLPGGYASPEQIAQAVNEWLDTHPEATTTVEDGSITRAKLDSGLNSYLDSVDTDISSLNEDITNLNSAIDEVDRILDSHDLIIFPGLNRFNAATVFADTILNSSGDGTSDNTTYNTSDYIYVGDLTSVKIYRNSIPVLYNSYYVLFDKNKVSLGARAIGNDITLNGAVYIRFSYSKTESNIQLADGSKLVSYYSAYQAPIEKRDSIRIINLEDKCDQLSLGNVLYGKKWVACGDSFTAGVFSGVANPEDRFIMSGKYNGENKVYPYIIGNRNNMDIINEAVSGSTMCLNDGTHNAFSTAGGRYTQIPEDADYITLYFGINDVNYSSPIGTIDDEDNTTFYGAWNIVCNYLIQNHPFAKIGIIVTNGASQAVIDAEIAIAKKWGLAYYDMNGLPLMIRSFNADASAAVKDFRTEQFRVSSTNTHPNVKAHEYESTCIEAWLRTL